MEWFVLAAPVPGAVEFSVSSVPAFVVMLLVAVAPVALAVREALGFGSVSRSAPQLRVLEGGKELSRRAA